MGKQVQVNAGFSYVSLPPDNKSFSPGDTTVLTDAEYAQLVAVSEGRTVTVLSTVADPDRTKYTDAGTGTVILRSPDGTRYKVSVANGGTATATAYTP